MGTEFSITGLADLSRTLQALPARIEVNVLRGALRAGQVVMASAVKANVPVKSGALRASIKIKTSSRRGKVSATLTVGGKKARHAHMVEFGTAAHLIKPKSRKSLFFAGLAREAVHHPGAAQHPFMRPAFDGETEKSLSAVRDYIATRLPKEIEKAGL